MGRLTSSSLASATRRRQDEMYELGKSAGRYGSKKLINRLRDKHCMSEDERDEFDKGVKKGKKKAKE